MPLQIRLWRWMTQLNLAATLALLAWLFSATPEDAPPPPTPAATPHTVPAGSPT